MALRRPRPVVAVMWTVDSGLMRCAVALAEEHGGDLVLVLVLRRPWTLLLDCSLAAAFDSTDLELESLLKVGAFLEGRAVKWTLHTTYSDTGRTVAGLIRRRRPDWVVLGRRRWRRTARMVGSPALPEDTKLLIV
ncbi:universal stress protein [Streptomyces sp. NPDC001027]|uniref:universal stress protein n=1 Tax=Streptomyces sp. NPDC001027 TaxID=3154771 RepID=UPI0033246FEF